MTGPTPDGRACSAPGSGKRAETSDNRTPAESTIYCRYRVASGLSVLLRMPKTVQGAQIRGRWRLGEDAIARARARLRDEGAFELEHCAIASAGRFCRRSVGPLQPHAHPRLHPPYSKASCTPEIVAFFPSRTTHPRLPLLAVVCLCCPRLRTIAVRCVSATRLTGL